MKFWTGWLVLGVSGFCSWSWAAMATEARFEVADGLDLNELQSSQTIDVTTGRTGDLYTVDGSAVMEIVPSRFEAAALDFDLQARLGMPDTAEGHSFDHVGDHEYAWVHMVALGTNSKHYFDINVYRDGANGLTPSNAWAATWQMVPGQAGWAYEDAPQFGRIEGSLYLMPLGNGDPNTKQPVYVRYFTLAQVRSPLPNFLIAGFVKGHFAADVQTGLRILESQAK